MIKSRIEAGRLLARQMEGLKNNLVVLSIPRGGVIVGKEIANRLKCPLDVVVSKKITPPHYPEYAIGAITGDNEIYKGPNWGFYSGDPDLEKEIAEKKNEVRRRLEEYRGGSEYQLQGKTVILVDDGIATGSTAIAILNWLQKQNVKEIILAVPVMPQSSYKRLGGLVQTIFALEVPSDFSAVGQFYEEFNQVEDKEVLEILKQSRKDNSHS